MICGISTSSEPENLLKLEKNSDKPSDFHIFHITPTASHHFFIVFLRPLWWWVSPPARCPAARRGAWDAPRPAGRWPWRPRSDCPGLAVTSLIMSTPKDLKKLWQKKRSKTKRTKHPKISLKFVLKANQLGQKNVAQVVFHFLRSTWWRTVHLFSRRLLDGDQHGPTHGSSLGFHWLRALRS